MIGFLSFYLLYSVNLILLSDSTGLTPEGFNKRLDPSPFLSEERAKVFK